MREDRPSETAAWVACWRGLAPWLPEGGQLANDPFGLSFTPRLGRPLLALGERWPSLRRQLLARWPLARMMLWLQVRTRALDDLLLAFVRGGGRQLVLLGAGFDCRASRFRNELAETRVFEIDHPATQRRKRAVLDRLGAPSAPTQFVSWNFERDPMASLGARLASLGHDRARPTFVLWEGVTPYLTEPAIESTVAAVRSWMSEGSQLAFTYVTPEALAQKSSHFLVAAMGEPFRFGWRPAELPSWMASHGMRLQSDESDVQLAERLLPASLAGKMGRAIRHVALAVPA